jgi:hypothetical protein
MDTECNLPGYPWYAFVSPWRLITYIYPLLLQGYDSTTIFSTVYQKNFDQGTVSLLSTHIDKGLKFFFRRLYIRRFTLSLQPKAAGDS